MSARGWAACLDRFAAAVLPHPAWHRVAVAAARGLAGAVRALPATATLRAVTSAPEREAALADFDNALGKYPKAAEYLDEQRAVERRRAARPPNDKGEPSSRIIVNRGLLPDPWIPESWRHSCRNVWRRLRRKPAHA